MESIEKEFDELDIRWLMVFSMREQMAIEAAFEAHDIFWGVPCGPTLDMVTGQWIKGICWGDYDGDPANY